MIGVIGGSGFEKFEEFELIGEISRDTPFGKAASGFKKVKVQGIEFLFMSRHGEHHEHLPTEVNYRANIFAMKAQGAQALVSFSAVGSLAQALKPGDLVVPSQYIDRTKSLRHHTFLGQGLIGHASLAKPTCEIMAEGIRPMAQALSARPNESIQPFDVHFSKTYICIEGPNFSTKAESLTYRQMGADIVGMTNFPEYALAREAGLPYLPCCWVTDYDCWDDNIPHVTVQEVIRVMRLNNSKAFSLLKEILRAGPALWRGSLSPEAGLRTSLFMPLEAVPSDKRKWLDVLMR